MKSIESKKLFDNSSMSKSIWTLKFFIKSRCLFLRFSYLLVQSSSSKSPILNPFLPVLSIYVGPIPFNVEPIFFDPLDSSEAWSISLCVGSIK